ncbi:hypothetical protein [Bifidobacterium crudilactis]|nr:hypothetical protein [Bifidobacterium crudilactis]MDN6208555.1 hypothetical protein [Bifidobacterium crudilactis]MDN6559203.1 hypothetical protein [Bifidobacterium crudilactis]MDN6772889.1 hypothetical protein [Bifidobacterium crudilactis]
MACPDKQCAASEILLPKQCTCKSCKQLLHPDNACTWRLAPVACAVRLGSNSKVSLHYSTSTQLKKASRGGKSQQPKGVRKTKTPKYQERVAIRGTDFFAKKIIDICDENWNNPVGIGQNGDYFLLDDIQKQVSEKFHDAFLGNFSNELAKTPELQALTPRADETLGDYWTINWQTKRYTEDCHILCTLAVGVVKEISQMTRFAQQLGHQPDENSIQLILKGQSVPKSVLTIVKKAQDDAVKALAVKPKVATFNAAQKTSLVTITADSARVAVIAVLAALFSLCIGPMKLKFQIFAVATCPNWDKHRDVLEYCLFDLFKSALFSPVKSIFKDWALGELKSLVPSDPTFMRVDLI